VVLDAGCGAGYGAARLADAGARHVYGIDASTKAIDFSRHHFWRPNLGFQVADLQQLRFPRGSIDFLYTSNTLEHVADVNAFLRDAHACLKSTGSLLVAVPPITDDRLTYLNVINPYHVNIWSPRQWRSTLDQFFGEIDVYLHGVSEQDFAIVPGDVEDMYRMFTLTAIFLARSPRPTSALPPARAPLHFVDDSFTRAPGEINPELRERLMPYFKPNRRSSTLLARRAWTVWRTEGAGGLARRVARKPVR
jgi:SAM-dependent methyltransferase